MKNSNIVPNALKAISHFLIFFLMVALSAALVSMLNLETAMFSQFGADMDPQNKWLMIALTGAGVSVSVVTISVYMIVKSFKEIKMLENNEYGKQRAETDL